MSIADPAALDSATLARRLHDLAGDERRVQVDFLLHLDEFDRRQAFLALGFGSLWDWCLKVLHLREGAAGRRIGAMPPQPIIEVGAPALSNDANPSNQDPAAIPNALVEPDGPTSRARAEVEAIARDRWSLR